MWTPSNKTPLVAPEQCTEIIALLTRRSTEEQLDRLVGPLRDHVPIAHSARVLAGAVETATNNQFLGNAVLWGAAVAQFAYEQSGHPFSPSPIVESAVDTHLGTHNRVEDFIHTAVADPALDEILIVTAKQLCTNGTPAKEIQAGLQVGAGLDRIWVAYSQPPFIRS